MKFAHWLAVVLLSLGSLAHATPVTYYFGGTFAYSSYELAPTIVAGTPFSGSFTYESTTTDSEADPSLGVYAPGPAFQVTINGLSYTRTAGGTGSVIIKDGTGGQDEFLANSGGIGTILGPEIDGFTAIGLVVYLHDGTATALTSDALPALPLDFDAFDNRRFTFTLMSLGTVVPPRLIAASGGPLDYLSVTPPSSPVPEPGSLILAAAPLLWLTVRRRKTAGAH